LIIKTDNKLNDFDRQISNEETMALFIKMVYNIKIENLKEELKKINNLISEYEDFLGSIEIE
jgi:hypothetical protein